MLNSNQFRPDETWPQKLSLLDRFALRTNNLWRIGLAYALLWCALLLWASFMPGSFWFTGNIEASPASQVMAACAVLTSFFIPFVVYYPVSRTNGHLNSFTPAQLSYSKTTRAYWKQVGACWLTTLMPLLSVYLLFALMSLLGFLPKDLVTPNILGVRFLIFVVASTLLTSTTSVGLAMSGSRPLHLIATANAVYAVMLPFILSEVVTGTKFESHLVTFVKGLGGSSTILIVPLLSSLLLASIFSWHYGHKKF